MHEPVDPNVKLPELEEAILEWWRAEDIPGKALTIREGNEEFVFYEGPPTANAAPGLHFIMPRVLKDIYNRYQTMKGRFVPRKAGWDCHGLPVELEVEKRLGFTNKQQIEEYGIERFNEACRASVTDYVSQFERLTERTGFWLDNSDPYWTMNPEYMESVWWSLAELHRRGLLYEGDKVAPYCPRCGTPLSDHELGQPDVYQDVEDPAITVAFPIVQAARPELEGASLLVWTTTPWTLPSNLAVAVRPDLAYVVARKDGNRYVVAEPLLESILGAEAVVEARLAGSDLVGARYQPPFDFARPFVSDAWRVMEGSFVTAEDGTGLVHLAPAFGMDDLEACRAAGIPTFNPVDAAGRFDERVPPFQGLFVKDADEQIVADLASRGLLFGSERYVHSYAHCWRCGSPLIQYALVSWYVRTTQFRDRLVEANRSINWIPPHIRDGRMGRWLENNVDWSLSRHRFWGTPLPIWRCPDRHDTAVESLADLGSRAGRDLTTLDLHRPHVDEVVFACPECGQEATRVRDLIDVWYDSGAMPYAQYGYPHRDVEGLFKERFPADFICEAIDQTRGWFYSLLAEGVLLFDDTAYRNAVCHGHLVDADGRKMSKSLGNAPDPWEVVNRFGSDALRMFFYIASPQGATKRYTEDSLEQIVRGPLLTLWNVYRLYVLYANVDGFDPNTWPDIAPQYRPPIDRWILGELHHTIAEVDESLGTYDCTRAGRRIGELIDDLSNWYVRRSRRRFWREATTDEDEVDKGSAYWTLWTCLVEISKLLAPFTPFLAESLYRNLVCPVNPEAPESVHLADFPESDASLVDPALAEAMAVARTLVSLGRSARTQGRVKVRQPLALAVLLVPAHYGDEVWELAELIADELNVAEVELAEEAGELVRITLKPNYPVAGPELGPRVRDLAAALEALGPRTPEIAELLEAGEDVELGDGLVVGSEHVEIRREPAEGTAFSYDAPFGVSIDLEITPELRREGMARELVHQLQGYRRDRAFEVTDRVRLLVGATGELAEALGEHDEYIRDELLATELALDDPGPEATTVSVDGEQARVSMELAETE